VLVRNNYLNKEIGSNVYTLMGINLDWDFNEELAYPLTVIFINKRNCFVFLFFINFNISGWFSIQNEIR
jgi:hypothetical protein